MRATASLAQSLKTASAGSLPSACKASVCEGTSRSRSDASEVAPSPSSRFMLGETAAMCADAFAGTAAMADQRIRFSDGASYDAMMGGWSRSVGRSFLEWQRPLAGLDWIDVGCGSGAFTSLVVERCAPKSILGVDPAEAQLDYARTRGLGAAARFVRGDAMALDLGDRSVDVAVAALVIHFMPDPARGVAEMTRVVRPGGLVGAYACGTSPTVAFHMKPCTAPCAPSACTRRIRRIRKQAVPTSSSDCGRPLHWWEWNSE